MSIFLNYILLFSFLILNSCIHLERNAASGYGSSNQKNAVKLEESNYASQTESVPLNYKMMADLGITPEALSKPEIRKKYELQLGIKSYEKYLNTDREKKQYYSSIPWFKSDEERMEFLKQPGYEARLLWMRSKGFGKRSTQLDDEAAELIEKKDIALGMSQDSVKKSWGPPDAVEIAGNPLYRNERWKYRKYISSTEGYKLQKRVIYFEGGKLVGWEQFDE
jgi:hypothetical protein